ncbi:MAG: hypothetical protein WB766_00445 [Roseiarcus sp.]
MHVNKVSRVRTIDRVAKDLGEDVDFLFDVAIEMEPKDGLIWVLSLGDESVMAFTDDGVDSLVELIKIHRETKPARGVLISAPSASPRGLCRTVTASSFPIAIPGSPAIAFMMWCLSRPLRRMVIAC